jgi:hypothetical protein
MVPDSLRAHRRHRVEELVRETAMLFIALSPIDIVLVADQPARVVGLLCLVIGGLLLFEIAVQLEHRRIRDS